VVRPYRSPLFPLPQLAGIGLLILASVKVFPDATVRSHIYRDYLIFLGVSIVIALVYNAWAQKSLTAQFRPVPLREVYAEVEEIAEHPPELGEPPRDPVPQDV
jgi:hypothetical protein